MCHIYFVLNQQARVRVRGLWLEWFDMILFVSNYPSYSLCLRPYILFTPSQTMHHILFVSDHMSYVLCLKLSMIFMLSQTKCHTYFVSNQLLYYFETSHHIHFVWSQPSCSICLAMVVNNAFFSDQSNFVCLISFIRQIEYTSYSETMRIWYISETKQTW